MKRKTFDLILTVGGAVLVVILAAAGALLLVGANYTNNNVHDQLARQEIFFPSRQQILTKHGEDYISRNVQLPYAGQQVLTGAQAKAYAYKVQMDMYPMPFHGVYSKVSAYSMAHPTTKKMAAMVTVTFRGTTLQGLLLEAYAFSQFGSIATDGAIAAFSAAFVLLLLTGLGLWHVRRTPLEAEFPKAFAGESKAA